MSMTVNINRLLDDRDLHDLLWRAGIREYNVDVIRETIDNCMIEALLDDKKFALLYGENGSEIAHAINNAVLKKWIV
jgi:SOS response regulatory protein OraA/RecX